MSEDIEVLKHKAVHKGELCFEGLYIDKCKRLVVRNENEIELTYTEFEILLLLAQNAGIVFSKEQIYDSVWKEPYFGDYNIVMSHIRNIREKIEDNPSKPIYIQTVWGVGYKLNENLKRAGISESLKYLFLVLLLMWNASIRIELYADFKSPLRKKVHFTVILRIRV